jgi:hypothetical protein
MQVKKKHHDLCAHEIYRWHQRDLLNLALKDEEPVVIKVDALFFEQICDVGEVALAVIDVVIAHVVLGCSPGHLKLTAWDHFVLVSLHILSVNVHHISVALDFAMAILMMHIEDDTQERRALFFFWNLLWSMTCALVL